MARWRRPGANEILLAFLLLEVIGTLCAWLLHASQNNPLLSLVVTAFFTWRVSRGGRISRVLLIIGSGAAYAGAVLDVARLWNALVLALLVVAAAQVALLISAPVYWHTRKAPVAVRATGWAQLAPRPPGWLLPWGLLAGVLATLASLGHMDVAAVHGCRMTATDTCTALTEGYPVHWLTAGQYIPLISKHALLKDCVQWALASMSVLYLGWTWAPGDGASSWRRQRLRGRQP